MHNLCFIVEAPTHRSVHTFIYTSRFAYGQTLWGSVHVGVTVLTVSMSGSIMLIDRTVLCMLRNRLRGPPLGSAI